MRQSESIAQLADDLAKAQGELKNASFNATNPHFKNKYADLAQLRDCTAPILSKHGLSVVQGTVFNASENFFFLATRLLHKSGEWIESTYPIPLDKSQAMGSAITYGRRYCLAAMLGIAGEPDDDGEAASNITNGRKGTWEPEKPGTAYKGTKLIHPSTPPGKKGDGPSAYSVKETPLWSQVTAQSSLDDLDGWWCKEETQDLKAKMPLGHQVELFERFIKQSYDVADSKQALKVFLDGYTTELNDLETVDKERFDALLAYAQDAKTKFSPLTPMDAG